MLNVNGSIMKYYIFAENKLSLVPLSFLKCVARKYNMHRRHIQLRSYLCKIHTNVAIPKLPLF